MLLSSITEEYKMFAISFPFPFGYADAMCVAFIS